MLERPNDSKGRLFEKDRMTEKAELLIRPNNLKGRILERLKDFQDQSLVFDCSKC